MSTSAEERHARAKREREAHVQAVLDSTAAKKIVVAGPGTGKTYLFKKVLQGKKNTLTLTFVVTGRMKTSHSWAVQNQPL